MRAVRAILLACSALALGLATAVGVAAGEAVRRVGILSADAQAGGAEQPRRRQRGDARARRP